MKVRTGEFLYDSDNVLLLDVNKDDGYLKFDLLGTGREEDHLNSLAGGDAANEILEILMMKRDGMSVRQIAEAMNIGKSTVQRRIDYARESNIKLPEDSKNPVPKDRNIPEPGQAEPVGQAA